MPHTWINLSFYSSKKRVPGSGEFVPRIKVPQEILKLIEDEGESPVFATINTTNWRTSGCGDEHSFPNPVFDYDAYDAQVFKIPTNQHNRLVFFIIGLISFSNQFCSAVFFLFFSLA